MEILFVLIPGLLLAVYYLVLFGVLFGRQYPRLIEYDFPGQYDAFPDKGDKIVLRSDRNGYPFNGKPVLIYITGRGWAEAWWTPEERCGQYGEDVDGFHWVVLDDSYEAVMLEDASHWLPLPPEPKNGETTK